MPGPYPEEVFDPYEGEVDPTEEEVAAWNSRRKPLRGTYHVGDIVTVCPWSSISQDLHHCVGKIEELFYGSTTDGISVIEDTKVIFTPELNGADPRYQRFYDMPNGVMLFPHEIDHLTPSEPTWEL